MNIGVQLRRLRNEDFIWIIYFFIAGFALLSNQFDREYLLNKDTGAYRKENTINSVIFFVAFFIYLYFVLITAEDVSKIKANFNDPRYVNAYLKLIAAILFLIGGFIYLIVEIESRNDPLNIGII